MTKNEEHKARVWELKTRISSYTFDCYDFSKTNFNSAIFDNVKFINCLFDKSKVEGSKLFYESSFDKCVFKGVDLSNSTFGSNKGIYLDCVFDNCNLKGKEFNFTRFEKCKFLKCKMSKINFNASSFDLCEFSGKMEDVSFNGIYNTNESDFKCLDKVDFSEIVFGEFVTFFDCDLSSCLPPKGSSFEELLYQLYRNDPKILSTGSKDRITLIKR